ncbi:MAG: serine O-acetyltransferase [Gammaproteobacteria bacterium]|nr:serine O-acetyltransferase [Gammaproteobacteria bacterium]
MGSAVEEVVESPLNEEKQSELRPSLRALIGDDIRCVFHRDPAARNRLEVMTTYPGVHAVVLYRLAHRLWQWGWRYLPRLISYIGRIWTSIDIHPGAQIGRRFFIDHGAGVVIGETAEVGDDVTLYHGVTLGGVTWNRGKRHPTLEDGVVVGAGAKILGPITIGRQARVGANSVVISSVRAGETVVGIPGKAVQAKQARVADNGDINLDHHLIPDPVAEAVGCLLDRIRQLETEVSRLNASEETLHREEECGSCQAIQLCETAHAETAQGG